MNLRSSSVRDAILVPLLVVALVFAQVADAAPAPAVASKVDAAVAEIDALRDATKFVEARDAVRKAVQQYAGEPDVKKLRDMEMAVRDQLRAFITMKADIEQLDAREAPARKVAVERLLGEEVGKIVLRQVVRDGAVPAAVAAGRGLAEIKDNTGIQAVLARAKAEKDVTGAIELIAILPDVSKMLAMTELPELAAWAHGKPAAALVPVREMMKRRAVGSLDAAELKTVADLATGPDSPARRGAVEFLAMVFRLNAKRNVEAFNKLLGGDQHAVMLAAIEKDRTSEDAQLVRWATRQRFGLLHIDREAISRGLHARWTLDTLGQGQFNDSGPSGRNLTAKNVDGRQVVPGILGKALAFTNDSTHAEWGNQAYRELQTNDFSLSAWVKVLRLQPNFEDTESVLLGSDVNGGRASGLILGTNGIVHFYLPVMVQPAPSDPKKKPGRKTLDYIHTSTKTQLVTNRWHHLAAAVSWSSGEVTIYVNGEISGRGAVTNNVTPAEVGSLRVGASKSQTKERRFANCLQGLIDDVRVYSRAITETDAAILFAQGELDQQ